MRTTLKRKGCSWEPLLGSSTVEPGRSKLLCRKSSSGGTFLKKFYVKMNFKLEIKGDPENTLNFRSIQHNLPQSRETIPFSASMAKDLNKRRIIGVYCRMHWLSAGSCQSLTNPLMLTAWRVDYFRLTGSPRMEHPLVVSRWPAWPIWLTYASSAPAPPSTSWSSTIGWIAMLDC
jgi:hypothetical protein